MTVQHRLETIQLDLVDPDPMNPQEQDLVTFNELVASIKENGMVESITVVGPLETGRYGLVAGEHRWKAARLAGLSEGPAIVVDPTHWALEERQIQLVRMNVLKGKLDPAKFAALWGELLKVIPDRAELKRRMGFDAKDAELNRLIRDTARSMPDERMSQDLLKRKDRIKSAEDLHTTVQSLFARYGSTLDSNFVVFTFLGKSHLMVRCTTQTFDAIKRLAERVEADGGKLDEELSRIVGRELATGEPATGDVDSDGDA